MNPARAARLRQFLRFAAVGTVGFLVDATVLLAGIRFLGLDPIRGRLLSFAVAVLATFELNRVFTFRRRRALPALAAYLGVQGLGFACNFAIYTILIFGLPAAVASPVLCVAVASGMALVVNYAGATLLVFRTPRERRDPP